MKNCQTNPLIIFLLVILLIMIMWILLCPRDKVKDKFNNLDEDVINRKIGGVLNSTDGLDLFENILKTGEVTLTQTAACAATNRHTCSPWGLIRKDLPPIVFNLPGKDTPAVGIIIDPEKIWDLIMGLGVQDLDTDSRNCCGNENGFPVVARYPGENPGQDTSKLCLQKMLEKNGFGGAQYKDYLVYQPTHDQGVCPSVCKEDDISCKFVNAGGGINSYDMMLWPNCQQDFMNCYNFKINSKPSDQIKALAPKASGYIEQSAGNCKMCTTPYVCVTSDAPTQTNPVLEDNQISAYVGKDGKNWPDLFMTYGGKPNYNSVITAIRQCKFLKDDWSAWINAIKEMFSRLISIINPKDNSMPVEYNYQLANPKYNVYYENEMNIYVNPDPTSDESKKQNEIFRDSILGFFYISPMCEDYFKNLNNTTTTYGNYTYHNAIDRCNGYYEMETGLRRQAEQDRISKARELTTQVRDMFNKKYSKNTEAYEFRPISNTFANYKEWSKTVRGEMFKYEDIFRKLD